MKHSLRIIFIFLLYCIHACTLHFLSSNVNLYTWVTVIFINIMKFIKCLLNVPVMFPKLITNAFITNKINYICIIHGIYNYTNLQFIFPYNVFLIKITKESIMLLICIALELFDSLMLSLLYYCMFVSIGDAHQCSNIYNYDSVHDIAILNMNVIYTNTCTCRSNTRKICLSNNTTLMFAYGNLLCMLCMFFLYMYARWKWWL